MSSCSDTCSTPAVWITRLDLVLPGGDSSRVQKDMGYRRRGDTSSEAWWFALGRRRPQATGRGTAAAPLPQKCSPGLGWELWSEPPALVLIPLPTPVPHDPLVPLEAPDTNHLLCAPSLLPPPPPRRDLLLRGQGHPSWGHLCGKAWVWRDSPGPAASRAPVPPRPAASGPRRTESALSPRHQSW